MRHTLPAFALATIFTIFASCISGDDAQLDRSQNAGTAPDSSDLALAAPAGKLPDSVRPTAYLLDLILDPRREEFAGEVAIDIVLDEPTNLLWLHGKNLDVSEVSVSTESGDVFAGNYGQVLESGVSAIWFNEELPAGNITLDLHYSASFDRNLAGLFKVEEQGDAYVLAKSESKGVSGSWWDPTPFPGRR